MLYAILLVVAAYTAVIVWQAHQLGNLSNQTNAQQKEAISNMVNRTMDEQLAKSLGETTQMEANIADDMFADLMIRSQRIQSLCIYTRMFVHLNKRE